MPPTACDAGARKKLKTEEMGRTITKRAGAGLFFLSEVSWACETSAPGMGNLSSNGCPPNFG